MAALSLDPVPVVHTPTGNTAVVQIRRHKETFAEQSELSMFHMARLPNLWPDLSSLLTEVLLERDGIVGSGIQQILKIQQLLPSFA